MNQLDGPLWSWLHGLGRASPPAHPTFMRRKHTLKNAASCPGGRREIDKRFAIRLPTYLSAELSLAAGGFANPSEAQTELAGRASGLAKSR